MDTLKCSSCGAVLHVDFDDKYIICEFCSSTNVNPHAYPKNHLEELKNDDINRAYAYIKNGEYKNAFSLFQSFANHNPNDYRGYWGMTTALTHDFDYLDIPDSEFMDAEKYYKKALIAASTSRKENINNVWFDYIKRIDSYEKSKADLQAQREKDALDRLLELEDKRNNSSSFFNKGVIILILYNICVVAFFLQSGNSKAMVYGDAALPFLMAVGGVVINIILCWIAKNKFRSLICVRLLRILPSANFFIVTGLIPAIFNFKDSAIGKGIIWLLISFGIAVVINKICTKISEKI